MARCRRLSAAFTSLVLLAACHARPADSLYAQWLSDVQEETNKAIHDAKTVVDEAAAEASDRAARDSKRQNKAETELDKAERRNKVFERMLQLVNIMGQVENFFASKIRNAVTTVALVVDHDYNDRLERANKWRS